MLSRFTFTIILLVSASFPSSFGINIRTTEKVTCADDDAANELALTRAADATADIGFRLINLALDRSITSTRTSSLSHSYPKRHKKRHDVDVIGEGVEVLQSETKGGEVFLGSSSIAAAIGMAYLGMPRSGDGETTVAKLFGVDDMSVSTSVAGCSRARIASQALSSLVDDLEKGSKVGDGVSFANSVWFSSKFTLLDEFKKAVTEDFKGGLKIFPSTKDATDTAVNEWVDENTNGMIPKLDTSLFGLDLALINALTFEKNWTFPFSTAATKEGEFTRGEGLVAKAMFMSQFGSFDYIENDDLEAVALPYKKSSVDGPEFEAIFVLPRDNTKMQATVMSLTSSGTGFRAFRDTLEPQSGSVKIPRIVDQRTFLSDTFLDDLCKLTGGAICAGSILPNVIDSNMGIEITKAIHQTTLSITEEGTRAAAVTVIGGVATGMPVEPFEFTADKPALLIIAERKSAAVIFAGFTSVGGPPVFPKQALFVPDDSDKNGASSTLSSLIMNAIITSIVIVLGLC